MVRNLRVGGLFLFFASFPWPERGSQKSRRNPACTGPHVAPGPCPRLVHPGPWLAGSGVPDRALSLWVPRGLTLLCGLWPLGGSPHVHPGSACVHVTPQDCVLGTCGLGSVLPHWPPRSQPMTTRGPAVPPSPALFSPGICHVHCSLERPHSRKIALALQTTISRGLWSHSGLLSCHRHLTEPTGLRHRLAHGGRGSSAPPPPSCTLSNLGLARTHQPAPGRRGDRGVGGVGGFRLVHSGTCCWRRGAHTPVHVHTAARGRPGPRRGRDGATRVCPEKAFNRNTRFHLSQAISRVGLHESADVAGRGRGRPGSGRCGSRQSGGCRATRPPGHGAQVTKSRLLRALWAGLPLLGTPILILGGGPSLAAHRSGHISNMWHELLHECGLCVPSALWPGSGFSCGPPCPVEDQGQGTEDRGPRTGDWRQGTGDQGQETRDRGWGQGPGDGGQH